MTDAEIAPPEAHSRDCECERWRDGATTCPVHGTERGATFDPAQFVVHLGRDATTNDPTLTMECHQQVMLAMPDGWSTGGMTSGHPSSATSVDLAVDGIDVGHTLADLLRLAREHHDRWHGGT
jgi:hypothetical protein